MRQRLTAQEVPPGILSVGRIPRLLSSIWLVLSGLFLVTTIPAIWYVTFPIFSTALLVFILSMRIRAYVRDGIFILHSYFKTISLPLEDIEFFGVDDYIGIWAMGRSTMMIGLAQLDVTMSSGFKSRGLPATLAPASAVNRLAAELNHLADGTKTRSSSTATSATDEAAEGS